MHLTVETDDLLAKGRLTRCLLVAPKLLGIVAALVFLVAGLRLLAGMPQEIAALKEQIEIHQRKAEFGEAVTAARRLLVLAEGEYGAEHAETAAALEILGGLYYLRPDYGDEEQPWLRSLVMREKLFGPDHIETAASLLKLGIFYRDRGDYVKAGEYLRRSRGIYEAAPEAVSHKLAEVLNALGWLDLRSLEFSKAERVLEQSLAERRRAGAPEDATTAEAYAALTWVYYNIDDQGKAESMCRQALRIYEAVLGPGHPFTAGSMIALATIFKDSGRAAAAEPLLRRGLEIQRKTLGEGHSATIKTLRDLGGLYLELGNRAAAEPILRSALEGLERTKGEQHPDLIYVLDRLADLVHDTGNIAEAERLEERAVRIGERANAKTLAESLGSLRHLACIKLETGQTNEASALAMRAQRIFEDMLIDALSFTSESERLQFHFSRDGLSLLASAGLASPLTSALLHSKGIVLDSMLEDRVAAERSNAPEARDLLARVQSGKARRAQDLAQAASVRAPPAQQDCAPPEGPSTDPLADAESHLARFRTGLGSARRAFSITTEQVQRALPTHAVLIEMVRYDQYTNRNRWEPRFGAILLPHQGPPRWLPLGSAIKLESLIKLYRHGMHSTVLEKDLVTVLQRLSEQLWAPIAAKLPAGTQSLIISPDGELNFVSFAALLTSEKRFVGETLFISYVASGRDLLSRLRPALTTDLEVWANPDFGAAVPLPSDKSTLAFASPSLMARGLRDWQFTPLPGAEQEGLSLKARASELGLSKVVLHLGKAATEPELRRVQSPFILHLATHGFFLPEPDSAHLPAKLNPMHRSGLALAGARQTLAAWARGEAPSADSDGVVTAEEVGSLHLAGTWLVVLAACDTGVGEARAGEGVLGLRRGFLQAGAQNLLMALWPIDDVKTSAMMTEFYAEAFRWHSAARGLAEVQRRWLAKLRVEKGLGEACQVAGPFILSAQGAASEQFPFRATR